MADNLLSVVVPVYNTEEYLDRCLESILSQSFQDFNLLLIDDGSQDESPKKCDNYADKYPNISVKHTENHGLSSARNLGISLSTSKYISFIDSDDWIEKYMFEKLVEDALEHNADIAGCNMYSAISESEKREKNEMSGFENTVLFKNDEVLKNFYKLFSVCNKIFKRALFDTIKFPVGKIFEDARTTYRLAAAAKVATFNRYNGYNYFQRHTGIIGTLRAEEMYDRVLMWNEIAAIVLGKLPEEYDYIVARKNRAIIDALSVITPENPELYSLLIKEIIVPKDNKILSESEKNKIMTLMR